jgi:hypothetical protein
VRTVEDLQCDAPTRESAREREGRIAADGGGQVRDFVAGGAREEKKNKLEMRESSTLSLP